ncbi:MAG: LysM peptidoglycan-binding domain-containing protein, partial [Oscillospiraceae bacterium]
MYNEICPPNSTKHVVTAGDTFWRLSRTYGVSVQSIADANPGVNADNLQIGSTLCIPTAPAAPVSPAPSTP